MTEQKRLQRARKLLAYIAEGCSPAAAWRKANPRNKASSDKSAADMFRRELRQSAQRWMEEHPDAPKLAGDWWQEPKRCIGFDARPCGKEIPRRQKRCTACADEQQSLNQRDYGRTYYRSHRERANAKRNERRGRQHQRERDEAAAAAKRAEEDRRAAMPRMIVDERTGEKYLYDPKTGERQVLTHSDDGNWRWIPVPRQREASQPGRAPRADRRSSKQLPASAGKQRKAEANGASPKRRCKTCAHPDRAAIDAELLQGVSLPTIAARRGTSSSALDRHRSRCVKAPTVGDILEPVDRGDAWEEWDGAKWHRIPAPRREHLRLIKGRPHNIPRRTVWSVDLNCAFCRKVYRRRRAR